MGQNNAKICDVRARCETFDFLFRCSCRFNLNCCFATVRAHPTKHIVFCVTNSKFLFLLAASVKWFDFNFAFHFKPKNVKHRYGLPATGHRHFGVEFSWFIVITNYIVYYAPKNVDALHWMAEKKNKQKISFLLNLNFPYLITCYLIFLRSFDLIPVCKNGRWKIKVINYKTIGTAAEMSIIIILSVTRYRFTSKRKKPKNQKKCASNVEK